MTFTFDDDRMGVLTAIWQEHDGAVDGGSPVVLYEYDTQDASGWTDNYQRPTVLQHPSGLQVLMNYGSSGWIADMISRVDSLSRGIAGQSPAAQDFVLYEYIGLSIPAVVDLAWPDVQLDFTAAHNGARTNGSYPGYDRFGRVVKQHWVDGNFTTHASSGVVPNIPPILELNYVYDKSSNRLAVLDGRPRSRKSAPAPRPPEVGQTNRDHVATHSLESG